MQEVADSASAGSTYSPRHLGGWVRDAVHLRPCFYVPVAQWMSTRLRTGEVCRFEFCQALSCPLAQLAERSTLNAEVRSASLRRVAGGLSVSNELCLGW